MILAFESFENAGVLVKDFWVFDDDNLCWERNKIELAVKFSVRLLTSQ